MCSLTHSLRLSCWDRIPKVHSCSPPFPYSTITAACVSQIARVRYYAGARCRKFLSRMRYVTDVCVQLSNNFCVEHAETGCVPEPTHATEAKSPNCVMSSVVVLPRLTGYFI